MRKVFIRRYIMTKGRFAKLILDGIKTTTIRLGKVIPKCSEVIIHSEGRPIAEAKIKSVVYKRVRELTEEDAKRDGYSSLQELIEDLRNMYNVNIRLDDVVSIIEFEVIKKLNDIDENNIYLGLSPYTIALLASRYLKDVLTEEEKAIINNILIYKSIRTVSMKLFGSINKRWIVRKILRRALAYLVDKEIIKVDQKIIGKLAEISSFWRKYLQKRLKTN